MSVYSAATQLIFREYDNIDDLTDDMIKIYLLHNCIQILKIYKNYKILLLIYIYRKNITNPEIKIKLSN